VAVVKENPHLFVTMAGSASQGKHQQQQREAKDAKKKSGGSVPGKKRNWSADAPIFLKVREGGKRLSVTVTTNVVNRALFVFFGERGGHRTRSLALIDALSRSLLRIYFGRRADKHCLSMVT
jgi:hypothetical protein